MDDLPPAVRPKPDHEPVLRPVDEEADLRVRRPLLWLLPLTIPLILAIMLVLTNAQIEPMAQRARREAAERERAEQVRQMQQSSTRTISPRQAQGAGRPVASGQAVSGPVASGPAASGPAGAGGGELTPVACEFSPWVGLEIDEGIVQAVKDTRRPYRILAPGAPATQDFAPARINFNVDDAGKILRVWCG
jgi:hypothetical protein